MTSAQPTNDALLSGFDNLDCGVIALDRNGRAVSLNSAARTLLSKTTSLRLNRQRLECTDARQNRHLNELIREMLRLFYRETGAGHNTLSLRSSGDTLPLEVTAFPARRPQSGLDESAEVCAIVLVSAARSMDRIDGMQCLYGLTTAETQVLRALAQGRVAKEIAKERGNSVNTIYNQIKSILKKTGCKRQSEVVRMAHIIPEP